MKSRDQIKELALEKGFTLREQPDGRVDLNPYVYEFAEALLQEPEHRIQVLEQNLVDAQEAGKRLAKQAIRAERERDALRNVCGEAYQLAGALDAPVEALDNLAAAMTGQPLPHASFLPAVVPAATHLPAHTFRELVNDLRDIARAWHGSDQLRERISGRLRQDVTPANDPARPVASEARYGPMTMDEVMQQDREWLANLPQDWLNEPPEG